jgi:hypothetical protein
MRRFLYTFNRFSSPFSSSPSTSSSLFERKRKKPENKREREINNWTVALGYVRIVVHSFPAPGAGAKG